LGPPPFFLDWLLSFLVIARSDSDEAISKRGPSIAEVVTSESIRELTARLCLEANFKARADVRLLLKKSLEAKNSPGGVKVLEQLIANADIAAAASMPLCQDCGYVTIFAEVGQDLTFEGSFEAAVQAGVVQAYSEGFLRQSVVKDALSGRSQTEITRPANVYVTLVPGNQLNLSVLPKGGGSDNASRLRMLRPTGSEDEIVKFVVDVVVESGINACPPLFVGIGLGGSFDSAALLSKKVLLRDFNVPAKNTPAAKLEVRLLSEINQLGLGPAGLGGETTALGVAVETDRTHFACLPVAVNLSCNQLRSAGGQL